MQLGFRIRVREDGPKCDDLDGYVFRSWHVDHWKQSRAAPKLGDSSHSDSSHSDSNQSNTERYHSRRPNDTVTHRGTRTRPD